jgi:hypothetical protein
MAMERHCPSGAPPRPAPDSAEPTTDRRHGWMRPPGERGLTARRRAERQASGGAIHDVVALSPQSRAAQPAAQPAAQRPSLAAASRRVCRPASADAASRRQRLRQTARAAHLSGSEQPCDLRGLG